MVKPEGVIWWPPYEGELRAGKTGYVLWDEGTALWMGNNGGTRQRRVNSEFGIEQFSVWCKLMGYKVYTYVAIDYGVQDVSEAYEFYAKNPIYFEGLI